MKTKSTLVCVMLTLCLNNIKAQVNVQDSLALVDLYNSTDGPHWKNNGNWLSSNPVPTWFGITVTNKRVTQIFLHSNSLNGGIPFSIGNLSSLQYLFLYDNQLDGSIPSSIGNLVNLTQLNLSVNKLSGSIPPSIGNLVNLSHLWLTWNQLTDNIPSSVGNLVNLEDLELFVNKLRGGIPSSIGNLAKLQILYLSNNKLSGSIPSSLGNLLNLQNLNLDNNKLSGSIPSSIGNLVNLLELELSGDQLTGEIPASFKNLINLVYFNLNLNKLSGSIPSFIGKFVNLQSLALGSNLLSGEIPFDIGNLRKLQDLYLRDNQLSGSIPTSIGNLVNLDYLDISYNRLNGKIPSTFTNLHTLNNKYSTLNISYNHLTFDGMELIAKTFSYAIYSSQANIPLHQHENALSVYAGGTLSNNTFKWFKCDGPGTAPILVATIKGDSTFHPSESGRYRVKVINSVATHLQLYTKLYDYTAPNNTLIASAQNGLQQYSRTTMFRVYPNPAKDILYVQASGTTSVSLLNQSGNIVLITTITGKSTMDISNLAAGVYYLKNNSTGAVQKVIIAR